MSGGGPISLTLLVPVVKKWVSVDKEKVSLNEET